MELLVRALALLLCCALAARAQSDFDADAFCEGKGLSFQPHPGNETLYVLCRNNTGSVLVCDEGLVYRTSCNCCTFVVPDPTTPAPESTPAPTPWTSAQTNATTAQTWAQTNATAAPPTTVSMYTTAEETSAPMYNATEETSAPTYPTSLATEWSASTSAAPAEQTEAPEETTEGPSAEGDENGLFVESGAPGASRAGCGALVICALCARMALEASR